MRGPFPSASWPAVASTGDAALWLTYRTFPGSWQDPYAIHLASSAEREMEPTVIAEGEFLSPPVMAASTSRSHPRVAMAWIRGWNRRATVETLALDQGMERGELNALMQGSVHGLNLCVDAQDQFWLAWTERNRASGTVWCTVGNGNHWRQPFQIDAYAGITTNPILAGSPEGLMWVFWHRSQPGGFSLEYQALDLDTHLPQKQGTVPMAKGEFIDLDPSVAVDENGQVVLTWLRRPLRWDTAEGYRLNAETQLMGALHDPATDNWFGLGHEGHARIEVNAQTHHMPVANRENPDAWAGPVSQTCFIDAEGGLRILYRRMRDLHGAYDNAFDLWTLTRSDNRWRPPHLASHTAGGPEAQYALTRMADGGAVLAYEFAHLPPYYLHMETRKSRYHHTQRRRSDVALIRLDWGGATPPIGRISHPQQTALKPGPLQVTKESMETFEWYAVPSFPGWPLSQTDPQAIHNEWGETCFFGDMHGHTDISWCMPNKDGNVQDHIRYAREYAQLDFWTLTDHLEDLNPAAGRRVMEAMDNLQVPGIFATFYGMEFTNVMPMATQDFCLFTHEREVAQLAIDRLGQGVHGEEFLACIQDAALRGKLMVTRHFHGGNDGESLDLDNACNQLMARAGHEVEPVLEVVQFRGAVHTLLNQLWQRGQRKGVIGGTDHSHPRDFKSFPRGRTGIWAPRLTGADLMASLYQRRTFATNGPKMVADMRLNDSPMGSESVSADGAIRIQGWITGTTPLRMATLYRDGVKWRELNVTGPQLNFQMMDEDPIPARGRFYWLHAVQEGAPGPDDDIPGQLWTSPTWLDQPVVNAP